ncbi:Peptidase A1 domain-containing protein [Aphelenchoides besseyi]|nr:Peptidase A1 domain-containing protein [Aphelenchoides besseyi]
MKKLLCLFLLLNSVSSLQIPLFTRTISPTVRNGSVLPWDQELSSFYQNEYPKEYLLTNLTVGTPAREFFLTVESGSKYLWILDETNPNVRSDQHTYNPNESSTSKFIRNDFHTATGHTDLYGTAFQDKINIGFSFNQAFGSISKMNSTTGRLDIALDGSLGLSWGDFGEDPEVKYLSPIVNMLGVYSFAQQFYTLWIGPHNPSGESTVDGLITVGNFDLEHCNDAFNFVPLKIDDTYDYMHFEIDKFSMGKYTQEVASEAYLDSGSPVVQVPSDIYNLILQQIQPDYDSSLNLLITSCSAAAQLPSWKFTINSLDYEIEGEKYVVDLNLRNDNCALALDKSSTFVLGLPFSRSYCQIFQLIGQNVGFTKPKK